MGWFSFYRSVVGEELDLVIEQGSRIITVECKASTAPQVSIGFWYALDSVQPDETYIVALEGDALKVIQIN